MILIFISTFSVEYLIQEVLASVSQKKLLVLCHQFCKVTVEEWHMAYIMIIEGKDEGWRQAGRTNALLGLSSSCILQGWQVGGGEL